MKTSIQEYLHLIQPELQAVERRLQTLLQSDIPIVSELGMHLTKAGGKRFRPSLLVFFYKMVSQESNRSAPKDDAIEIAALLEMIHMATLAHDDVIDQAEERRHQASLHAVYSNRQAVYEGDFIFSRVFKVLNRYESTIRAIVIDAVEDVLEGELLQESLRWKIATEDEYFRVIQGKTASLIAAASALGSMLGDTEMSSAQTGRIFEAGLELGTAYQMVDDLLDIFGDDIGKPVWSDRAGGWLTLPFIRLLEKSRSPELLTLLQAKIITAHEREFLLSEFEAKGIRDAFLRDAKARVERAKPALDWLPESELKRALYSSFNFVIDRKL
jgi:geranylgeranyl pyrophosphate synthase